MDNTTPPIKVPVPFANTGQKNTIPTPSQQSITPGAASLTDGFPPITFTPVAQGGIPPFGADFNGILNLITQTIRLVNAGGSFTFDANFAAAIGGYPKNARLLKADYSGFWINQVDNNTVNPDTTGTNWITDPTGAQLIANGGAAYIGTANGQNLQTLLNLLLVQGNEYAGIAGGTANALTLTPTPAITAYSSGQIFRFSPSVNNTGAATVAVSGLSALSLLRGDGTALQANDLIAGQAYTITCNSAATSFVISGPYIFQNAVNTSVAAAAAASVSAAAAAASATSAATSAAAAQIGTPNRPSVKAVSGTLTNGAFVGTALAGTYSNGSSGVGATFTLTATGVFTAADGQALSVGDSILLASQTDSTQNGIYTMTTAGASGVSAVFTRRSTENTPSGIQFACVLITGGTLAGYAFYVVTQAITIGTTQIVIVPSSSTAGVSGLAALVAPSGTSVLLSSKRAGVLFGWVGSGGKLIGRILPNYDLIVGMTNLSQAIRTNATNIATTIAALPVVQALRTGLAFGQSISNGKLPFFVDSKGNPISRNKNINRRLDDLEAVAIVKKNYITPQPFLAVYGDSLTAIGLGPTLVTLLQMTRGVIWSAIGGQTSDQIAQRQRGLPIQLTISGNSIPAGSTSALSVTITTPSTAFAGPSLPYPAVLPLSTGSDTTTRTLHGTLMASTFVQGTLTRTATGTYPTAGYTETYTFTPDAAPASAILLNEGPVVFKPDTQGGEFFTQVLWPGRNDIADNPISFTQANIIRMIGFLKPIDRRFVLLSVLNTNTEYAANTTSDGHIYLPSQRYANVVALNAWMQATYPDNFIDVRKLLVNSGTSNPASPNYNTSSPNYTADQTDFANDCTPTSLRADGVHLNSTGFNLVGNRIIAFLTQKGW